LYTVLLYTHTHTHTSAVISASRSLSPAFVSDFFVSIFAVYTPLATTFTAFFVFDFVQKSTVFFPNSFFLLEVSRELPQRSTLNMFFHFSQFSRCSLHSLTLFALTFLCVSQFNPVIFCSVPNLPHLHQFTHSFASQWLPIFFVLLGTSAQQVFGQCQLFPNLQT
jgi:hypothetical protein